MPKFIVRGKEVVIYEVEIDADTEDDARSKARLLDPFELEWQEVDSYGMDIIQVRDAS